MSIELDPQEVLEHLYSLGYYNISKEQLKEFINDLKKLIKYDLLKKEKRYFVDKEIRKTDKDNICTCSHLTSTKTSPRKVSTSAVPDSTERYNFCRSCQSIPERSSVSPSKHSSFKNVQCKCCVSHKPITSVEHSCHLNVEREFCKEMYPQHTGTETDEESIPEESAHASKRTLKAKKKPCSASSKKQSTSLKPCPSFIRPASSKGQPPKGDPVALYHYYKSLWSQHTLPGESSREDLRWRVRHKMMAPPAVAKGLNEEKVNKRPEWVTS